jgi:hypothetical protein
MVRHGGVSRRGFSMVGYRTYLISARRDVDGKVAAGKHIANALSNFETDIMSLVLYVREEAVTNMSAEEVLFRRPNDFRSPRLASVL